LDDCLVGFSAGFSWGKLLLLVPNRNAQGAVKGTSSARKANKGSYMKRAQHGKVWGVGATCVFICSFVTIIIYLFYDSMIVTFVMK